MNREKLFRAWYSGKAHPNKMYYFDLLGAGNILPLNYRELGTWHVMEYTGLKDTNGREIREIYEGDIVSIDIKVIGNIYENPELGGNEYRRLVHFPVAGHSFPSLGPPVAIDHELMARLRGDIEETILAESFDGPEKTEG